MANPRSAPPSPLDAHLGFWLRLVSNHVFHAFRLKVEAHGVTVAEWVVLRDLLAAGTTQPSAVADRLGLTRGAVSKLVDRLLVKKLVSRTAARADKRCQRVALTAAGGRLVPTLARLADRNDDEFFGHLGAGGRAVVAATLKGIVRRHGLRGVPTE